MRGRERVLTTPNTCAHHPRPLCLDGFQVPVQNCVFLGACALFLSTLEGTCPRPLMLNVYWREDEEAEHKEGPIFCLALSRSQRPGTLPSASQARLCPPPCVLLPWPVPRLLASLPLPPSSLSFSKLVVLVPAPEDQALLPGPPFTLCLIHQIWQPCEGNMEQTTLAILPGHLSWPRQPCLACPHKTHQRLERN